MTPIAVLILYFIVVAAAAAAVLMEYRRLDLGRFIKAGLCEGPKTRPEVTVFGG